MPRAIRPETRFGKNRVSHATDGWHPPDARVRGRGEERARRNRRRRHHLHARGHSARVTRVRDAARRPSRRQARRSARARSANPKHALAMPPGPARSLERATRGQRGDVDFENRRHARTILSNPDYYVTRCTCAADRGLAGGTTGIFGHRLARTTRVPNSETGFRTLGSLKKAMGAGLFCEW